MSEIGTVAMFPAVATCQRCGRLCRSAHSDNLEARPFRRAEQGLCINCIVTAFFQTNELFATLLGEHGPEALLNPLVQQQFGAAMAAGHSDGSAGEIDWGWIVDHWALPLPSRQRRIRQ